MDVEDIMEIKMDAATQIQKHERAIEVLGMVKLCQKRLDSYNRWITDEKTKNVQRSHYLNRIEITTAMKSRLENYYNKSFKI